VRRSHLFLSIICTGLMVATAAGQFKEGSTGPGEIKFGEAKAQRWKIGVTITAVGGTCMGVTGYVPVPMDWPEQQVRVVKEDISPLAKTDDKVVDGTVKLMVVKIAKLPSGQSVNALVTYEVTHHPQLPPEQPDQYVLPDVNKLPRGVRGYLRPSPKIESKDPKIRKLAEEIRGDGAGEAEETDDEEKAGEEESGGKGAETPKPEAESEPASDEEPTAWQQVEAIYDWVRDHVTYKRGPQKSAVQTLKDGVADCEGMTALFIALCRAKNVPARTVGVQGHCYPEFYLADKDGKGYWFPCQVAGDRSFGGIPETRPILQKGDNFRQPGNTRQRVHYLATFVTGNRMAGKPRVSEVCQPAGE